MYQILLKTKYEYQIIFGFKISPNTKKTCFKCDICNKYLKSVTQLRKHSRKCVPSEEEDTDESESSNWNDERLSDF